VKYTKTREEFRTRNKNNLKLATLNINSMEKFDKVSHLLTKQYIDIFCIQESRKTAGEVDKLISKTPELDQYKWFVGDCDSNSNHKGGVITFVNKSLTPREITSEPYVNPDNDEQYIHNVICEVTHDDSKYTIINIYKSPKMSNNVSKATSHIVKLLSDNANVIMLGDMNTDRKDLPNLINFSQYGLENKVTETTSTKSDRSIDVCIMNAQGEVDIVYQDVDDMLSSGHRMIMIGICNITTDLSRLNIE
jgi:exonuclease III